MFKEMLDFCVDLLPTLRDASQKVFAFMSVSLNDLFDLDIDLDIMNYSIVGMLFGAGLVSFLTYKLISFLIDIAP